MKNEGYIPTKEEIIQSLGYLAAKRIKERREKVMGEVDMEKAARVSGLSKESWEPNDTCSIVLMPIAKGMGSSVRWQPRLHRRGLAGPLEVSLDNLVGCGLTEYAAKAQLAEIETALVGLRARYPVEIQTVEDLRTRLEAKIKAIEAGSLKLSQGE